MKWVKRIALVVSILVVITLAIVYFSLNAIVRGAVERQSSASLNVPTTLGGARLALFGGQVGLDNLQVGSPPNYSAPHMFTLGGVDVQVSYGQFSNTPMHVGKIVIDQPVLLIQRGPDGKYNFQSLMEQMPQSTSKPMKLIIDELDVNNAQVNFQPGIRGMPDTIPIAIPSMQLKNVGNADGANNGAAIKDVVMQLVTTMTAKAASSGKLPIDVNKLLNAQLSQISAKLGAGVDKQIQDITGSLTKDLPPEMSGGLKNITGDQSKSLQQGLDKGLGGLLGGKKPAATQP